MTKNPFVMEAGATISRKQLHDQAGGRRQGGIGPSRETDSVFIFTNAQEGRKHGYYDGWGKDGFYHYTGEGQRGDQTLTQGNGAIANHVKEGRDLHLFSGVSGDVRYAGKFTLAEEDAYYETDAPETNNGPLRTVVVFRLIPEDAKTAHEVLTEVSDLTPQRFSTKSTAPATTETIPIEVQTTERAIVAPQTEEHEMERKEHKLVLAYGEYLRTQGRKYSRQKILPPGEAKPLFTDIFDEGTATLIEAKGTTTREAVRMAIGQLLDYRRFVEAEKLAILLPARPRPDLLDLIAAQDIQCIWPDANSFKCWPDVPPMVHG